MNVDKCCLLSYELVAILCTGMLMGHSYERGKEVEVVNVENKREQIMSVCGKKNTTSSSMYRAKCGVVRCSVDCVEVRCSHTDVTTETQIHYSHAEDKAGAVTQKDETDSFLFDQGLLSCFSDLFFFVFEVQLIADASIDRTVEFPVLGRFSFDA